MLIAPIKVMQRADNNLIITKTLGLYRWEGGGGHGPRYRSFITDGHDPISLYLTLSGYDYC